MPTITPSNGVLLSPSPGADVTPSPVPSIIPSGMLSSPTPTAQPGAVTVPAELAVIRFADNNNRFLDRIQATTQLQVVFFDKLGQRLPLDGVPLEWSSNRPQDFAVDASGQAKALVESGFSVITVKVVGTSLQAQTVVNVNTPFGGGGGGGGGSSTPTIPITVALTKAHPDPLFPSDWVQLAANGANNGTPLGAASYTWRCLEAHCNNFTPAAGAQVYWQAPAAGIYTIAVTVSNGTVEKTEQMTITVTHGSGNVMINPVSSP